MGSVADIDSGDSILNQDFQFNASLRHNNTYIIWMTNENALNFVLFSGCYGIESNHQRRNSQRGQILYALSITGLCDFWLPRKPAESIVIKNEYGRPVGITGRVYL